MYFVNKLLPKICVTTSQLLDVRVSYFTIQLLQNSVVIYTSDSFVTLTAVISKNKTTVRIGNLRTGLDARSLFRYCNQNSSRTQNYLGVVRLNFNEILSEIQNTFSVIGVLWMQIVPQFLKPVKLRIKRK